ncbi:hypothetical protein SAMN05421780_11445 [Flexibacter flexilis DSM 6793]|uniref:Uncharacterized protein n=1 Tax=Flexibacter flexilis DSM 6793 TaxID=927664 RepID=A0A1I1NEX7_9BACT|nr:hypothetical protein SAMN05421780_11445 [Flexibacter flexilis DSM 6793]
MSNNILPETQTQEPQQLLAGRIQLCLEIVGGKLLS